jgi:hypothetical protein
MRRDKATEEEKEEPVRKYIAFWSDLSDGIVSHPGCRKFYTREDILTHLKSRLGNLDDIYQQTTAPYRIESARVMTEALTKLIRKVKQEQNLAAWEEHPLNISGTLAEYCKKHRREVGEGHPRQPEVLARPTPTEALDYLEGD